MKTITLPVVVVAFLLFAIIISYQLIVNRRCRNLKQALLQICKELFDIIGELRDLSGKMKMDKEKTPSFYIKQLDDLSEKERKVTAAMKNTIQDAL